jgi:hypothetical protein
MRRQTLVMTPEQRRQMIVLCGQIVDEKDGPEFDRPVRALSDLLEVKHERIHPEHKPS